MIASIVAAGLFYVAEPAVTMREEANDVSRVASQTIFAEKVEVVDRKDGWCFIVTPDTYKGWIHATSVVEVKEPYSPTARISRLAAHIYSVEDTELGPIMTLPYDSKIQVIDDSASRWIKVRLPDGKLGYVQRGDIAPEKPLQTKTDLVDFSKKFLNIPYTWGGRTSFGYDCSGFVQMLYGKIGIDLLRDSRQQVLDSRFATVPVEKAEPGDLVFFGKPDGHIVHAGMCLGDGKFIHSTVREQQPWIHISDLNGPEWNGEGTYLPVRIIRQYTIKK